MQRIVFFLPNSSSRVNATCSFLFIGQANCEASHLCTFLWIFNCVWGAAHVVLIADTPSAHHQRKSGTGKIVNWHGFTECGQNIVFWTKSEQIIPKMFFNIWCVGMKSNEIKKYYNKQQFIICKKSGTGIFFGDEIMQLQILTQPRVCALKKTHTILRPKQYLQAWWVLNERVQRYIIHN